MSVLVDCTVPERPCQFSATHHAWLVAENWQFTNYRYNLWG